jgi:hypothetical protein
MDTPNTEVLDQQDVVSAPADLLPGGKTVAASKPTAEAALEPTAQTKEQPKAPEPLKAEEVKDESAPEVVDPYEAAALASIEGEPKEVQWTDDAKAALKARFGVEDPIELETRINEAQLLKQEYDALLPIKQGLEALPPALKNAFSVAMSGKTEEALKYLKELPDGVFMNKEAKSIPSDKLIPMYLEGKMSKDDFEILKNPSDYDEDVVAAVKLKEKHFRDIASDMHERKLSEVRSAQEQAQVAQKQAYEQYVKNVAETISHAKNTTLKAFVTKEFEQEIHTGSFVRRLLQEDGVTPTPEAATLLLKALSYDNMVKAQYNVGYKRGKSEGTLDAANGKPGVPPVAGRSAAAAPSQGEMSAAEKILANLGMRR